MPIIGAVCLARKSVQSWNCLAGNLASWQCRVRREQSLHYCYERVAPQVSLRGQYWRHTPVIFSCRATNHEEIPTSWFPTTYAPPVQSFNVCPYTLTLWRRSIETMSNMKVLESVILERGSMHFN